MKVKLFAICCLTLVIAAAAIAVPQYINYQGVLRDASGNLVIGTKQMTFKIYDSSSGGAALWSMTSPEVAVSNGLYTVKLGPLTNAEIGSGSRWLEVTVGTDTLSPRLEILAAAYAINAASAESAAKLGSYSAASNGASIIPYTDSNGKLSVSVIPTTGLTADNASYATLAGTATTAATATTATSASYATLSGTASNAATVDNLHASSTATESQLLALDANKQLKGMSVSAEAGSNPYALFVNGGKIGATTGNNMVIGTDQIAAGNGSKTVSNTTVTASSIILLTVGHAGGVAASNSNGGIRISAVNASTSFTVNTMDGNVASDNIPFSYLIIN